MRTVILFLSLLMLCGGIWWLFFYDPYRPTAYVGVNFSTTENGRTIRDMPAYVLEVDLNQGTVSDSFPLGDNTPVVKSLAVNRKENKLFVGGDGTVEHQTKAPENFEVETSSGIDIYDLQSKELIRQIEFETDQASISVMRFTPDFERLFINRPLTSLSRPENPTTDEDKITWIVDPEAGELVGGHDTSLDMLSYIGPSNEFIYGFSPKILREDGSTLIEASRWVRSIKQNKIVEHIKGRSKVIKNGGWQPDPSGKYEEEPFVLEYPQTWGRNPIRFYDRKTLKKIGSLRIAEEGSRVKIAGPRQETITRDGNYFISQVDVLDREKGRFIPYLKFVDMEKMKVVRTIRLDISDRISGMTYAVVN